MSRYYTKLISYFLLISLLGIGLFGCNRSTFKSSNYRLSYDNKHIALHYIEDNQLYMSLDDEDGDYYTKIFGFLDLESGNFTEVINFRDNKTIIWEAKPHFDDIVLTLVTREVNYYKVEVVAINGDNEIRNLVSGITENLELAPILKTFDDCIYFFMNTRNEQTSENEMKLFSVIGRENSLLEIDVLDSVNEKLYNTDFELVEEKITYVTFGNDKSKVHILDLDDNTHTIFKQLDDELIVRAVRFDSFITLEYIAENEYKSKVVNIEDNTEIEISSYPNRNVKVKSGLYFVDYDGNIRLFTSHNGSIKEKQMSEKKERDLFPYLLSANDKVYEIYIKSGSSLVITRIV